MLRRTNQFVVLIAIYLSIVSCNDDKETPEVPQPSFDIKGTVTDPITGNESDWNTNVVDVKFNAQGLSFKAGIDGDTIFVAVESVDSGMYIVDGTSLLSEMNQYKAFSPVDSTFTLYTYQADGNGGIIFNILNNDPIKQRVGGFFSAEYFNPINNSDFFRLNDAEFTFSYAPPPGEPGFVPGVGFISFIKDGLPQVFPAATGINDGDTLIVLQGITSVTTFPSINLNLADTLGVDTFFFGEGNNVISANYVQSLGGNISAFIADSGFVIITMHDTISNDISGQFSFKALNESGTDSIYLNAGAFEMNYID
ncbi:MAG: DUF6252 family protein [Flavobacteriales bacterium]|nr:DUF6252 family protein [Flavobacteriales bacterium]